MYSVPTYAFSSKFPGKNPGRSDSVSSFSWDFTFLNCNSAIANADNLKELYSRAQGEVSIREALRELDLWGAGANFSLTGYMDSAAKELSIIKDWKELVNQVSVYPRLVYV